MDWTLYSAVMVFCLGLMLPLRATFKRRGEPEPVPSPGYLSPFPNFTAVSPKIITFPHFGDLSPPDPTTFYAPYPALGWRLMHIVRSQGKFWLRGMNNQDWFSPFQVARCTVGIADHSPTYLPWSCTCGIYARNQPFEDTPTSIGSVFVLTAMDYYLEYTEGYRAGRAWLLGAYFPYSSKRGVVHSKKHPICPCTDCVQQNVREQLAKFGIPHAAHSYSKLLRVYDYYTNNPERIPTWEQLANPSGESNP